MILEDPIYIALYQYTKALSAALGFRDQLTQLHSERVLGLSEVIGVGCGLSTKEMGILKIAASFHDIGKIGIPDHILLKPSKFDEAEWEIMKQHTEIGAKIMSATELEGSSQAAHVIRHHHEFFNGFGYPDGLSGDAIPLNCRIISIADGYDAMAMTRAYHQKRKHSEVMSILCSESGMKYDPQIIRLFCEIIETSHFKVAEI